MLTDKMLSAVVICYKDELNIRALYERLSAALRSLTERYEIIYVNDASPDGSAAILRELSDRDPHLTVVHPSRNFGAQAAFTSGMLQAIGDAVILLDGDLQDPPELIEAFVRKWQEGYEVVYGVRRRREKSLGKINEWLYHSFYRFFHHLSYVKAPVDAGEFSLMDHVVVEWMNALPERDRLIRGLRAWVGFRQTGGEYVRPERYAGVSTNSFLKNLRWARKAIISFSYAPLEWVSTIAGCLLLLSLAGVVFYAGYFFLYPGAPRGLTTVYVLVLFLGSVQLLSLSVIAEYVGRIFEETKQRPRAIVRDVWNNHRR